MACACATVPTDAQRAHDAVMLRATRDLACDTIEVWPRGNYKAEPRGEIMTRTQRDYLVSGCGVEATYVASCVHELYANEQRPCVATPKAHATPTTGAQRSDI